ncbi:MAG TPA: hypothetical protein PKC21_08295 [Oligoflexia bacterium]|nr:hypothetical protein [Oligoflexia bacterium]HMR25339.1 hypothetical protein [Oligoflexia bacterium]
MQRHNDTRGHAAIKTIGILGLVLANYFNIIFAQSNTDHSFNYIGAQHNMLSNQVSWKQVRESTSGPLLDLKYIYKDGDGHEEILELRDHPAFNYFSHPEKFIPEARRMMDHIYLLLDNVYAPEKRVYHSEDRTLVRKKLYDHLGMLNHFFTLSCNQLKDDPETYLAKFREKYNEEKPSFFGYIGGVVGFSEAWEDHGLNIMEARIRQCNEGYGNIAQIYRTLSEILHYQLNNNG